MNRQSGSTYKARINGGPFIEMFVTTPLFTRAAMAAVAIVPFKDSQIAPDVIEIKSGKKTLFYAYDGCGSIVPITDGEAKEILNEPHPA